LYFGIYPLGLGAGIEKSSGLPELDELVGELESL
jgi:hypothetical protein